MKAFDTARNAAQKASPQVTRYLHSSVILDRKEKIIAVGRNHYQGLIIQTEEGPIRKTVHSEIHALYQVNVKRLDGATIINYACTNVASILARPCDDCWAILNKLGFRKVFYTLRSDIRKPTWREEIF